MKTATRLIMIAALLAGTFFVSSTLACSSAQWTSTAAGATVGDPTGSVPRVNGFCGLEVTGTGHVVDNTPTAEATFIGRFYVYPKLLGAGVHEIFAAYSDEVGTKLFSITYDGTNFNFDATAATGGGATSVVADTTHWNLIEFKWESGVQGSAWVNVDSLSDDPVSGTFASGTGSVEQVRLGAVAGIDANQAWFDDYESHRSQPVGALLAGDGNSDGNINSGDVDMVVNEFLFSSLAGGVPDCNLDGNIDSGDVDCIVKIFLNL